MRGRVIAAFVVGFAIGALCIGAALWSTGSMKVAYSPPWLRTVPAEPPAPAVPNTSASAQLPNPPVPPPEGAPAAQQGFAERAAAEPATTAANPGTTVGAPATATTGSTTAAANPPLHLAMPLEGVDPKTLTDTFNEARAGHQHEALDIMAPQGTPVHAVAEGNVVKLFTSKQGGLTVYQFDNPQQYAFYYAHLDHYAKNLKEGMLLRKGDILGYVGSTGDAAPEAPHLHFAVFKLGPEKQWWKGTALDPLPMLK